MTMSIPPSTPTYHWWFRRRSGVSPGPGPGPGPGIPTDMVIHLDAAKITGVADGAEVSTWADLSGNGFDVTQITQLAGGILAKPNFVASAINNLPSVKFDCTYGGGTKTTGLAVKSDNLPFTTAGHSFVVFQVLTTQVGGWSLLFNDPITGTLDWHEVGWQGSIFRRPRAGPIATGFPGLPGPQALYEIQSGTQLYNAYINNSLLFQSGPSFYFDSAYWITVGCNPSQNNGFMGYIGEILIYNRILTSTERDSVNNYLKTKWGIT